MPVTILVTAPLALPVTIDRRCSTAIPLRALSHRHVPGRPPVSYTHLRAHETKANLVCRLLLENLTADNLSLAVEIASMPEQVSGYGHIKEKALHEYEARQQVLLAQWPAGHVAVRKRA